MNKTVLLLGCDGYIGNALTQRLLNKGYKVIGVDNFLRRYWIKDVMASKSATPIMSMTEKISRLNDLGEFIFHPFDLLNDGSKVEVLIATHKPATVINLAHIPSAPFSQISQEKAEFTLVNNIIPTNNLLWAIKKHIPDAHYITIGTTGEYDHYSNIDIEEGYIKINHKGRLSNEMIYPRRPGSLYHCCYDINTEVLTDNGWKFFKDLSYDDKIATLNKDKDLLEYQKPTNIFNYAYDGDMVAMRNRSVDLMVTPNHKVFETSRRTNKLSDWRLTAAAAVYGKNCVMRRGVNNWVGEDLLTWKVPGCEIEVANQHYKKGMTESFDIDIDKWLLFFGWWLTEGSLYKNNIHISQQKDYNFDEIIKSLSIFDRKVQTNISNGKTNCFSVKHYQLSEYLKSFGKSADKYIPKEIKKLPKERLRLLLATLLKGDGHVDDKHYKLSACYYTISKVLADDVQEIVLKCGYSASVTHYDRGNNREYVVYITDSMTTQFITSTSITTNRQRPLYSKKPYKGTVYCAEVPNSIMYVRRNGKAVWSGNSKTASTYIIDFLSRTWNLKCTDVQQSVVFGSYTDEIDETKVYSRLDSDEAGGTVINRFIVQTLLGVPMTIYGEGLHQRGFISLNDSIQALEIAVNNPPTPGKVQVWNQLSEWHSMVDVAKLVEEVATNLGIPSAKQHIPSPRSEHTGEHYYNYIVDILPNLGYTPTRSIKQEIEYTMSLIKDTVPQELRSVIMPKILWEHKNEQKCK